MAGRSSGFVALLLVLALSACRSTENTAEPSLRPVAVPDLAAASEPVRKQIHEAHAALTAALERPGASAVDRATAYGTVGNVFMAAQLYDPAEAAYLNAHTLAPDDFRWAYYLGQVYRGRGEPAKAADFFERAVRIRPDDLAALVYLGDEYLSQGRPEAAEPPLRKALGIEPKLGVALFGLGRSALARKDYAAAVEHFERALALDPKASIVRYPLAMAYRELGQPEKASLHLRQRGDVRFAYLPDPLMLDIQQRLASGETYEYQGGVAFDQGEYAAAAWYFRKGVEIDPRNGPVRFKLAEALRRSGGAQESLQHYEQAIALMTPGEAAAARFGYAMGLVRLGRYREARDRLAEGMKLHPDRRPFGQALVRLLAAAPDAGVRDGQRALALTQAMLNEQKTPDLYETLAMALAEVGQFQQAVGLQRELVAAASRAGRDETAQRLAENLRSYENRQPCRTPWRESDMP